MIPRRALLAPLALLVGLVLALVMAGTASADPVSDATTTLQSSGVYLETGAQNRQGKTITVDEGKVNAAFGSTVKVAIFGSGTTVDAGNLIETSLGAQKVLAVIVPGNYAANSNFLCDGRIGPVLGAALADNANSVAEGDYTAAMVEFGTKVLTVPRTGSSACPSGSSSGTGASASGSSGSGSSAWPWIAGLGGVIVIGGGGLVYSRRRRTMRELEAAKANVMPYYDRLASDVNTLNAADNPTARQAMADASERYNAAGSQMVTATTVQHWSVVRRTTLEGLQAAQTARAALGLPRGPELPPIEPTRGEQLTAPAQVEVQGQQYQGYPNYTPGAPHYFGGGGGYPGGWYSFPFWETVLIGSVLGGGFGGWGGGGGFGNGYDSGYSSGYNAGQDAGNDPSGNSSGNDGGWGGGFGGGGDGGWGGGFGGGGDFGGGGGGSDGGSF